MNIIFWSGLAFVLALFVLAVIILPWMERRETNRELKKLLKDRADKFAAQEAQRKQYEMNRSRDLNNPKIATQDDGTFFVFGDNPEENAILIKTILDKIKKDSNLPPTDQNRPDLN